MINSYTYKIESRDIDFAFRTRISSIYDFALQAACDDADRNGFGTDELKKINATWVMSRLSMEIYRSLCRNDVITVYTWVNDVSRLVTTRNIEIYDANGEKVAALVSLWAMMDLNTRTSLDLRTHMTHYADCLESKPSPIMPPAKSIVLPDSGNLMQCLHPVVYSDLDFNAHVNSVRYLQWMMDILPLESFGSRTFARLDIHYIREARYGETLKILCHNADKSIYEIHNGEDQPICKSIISWH